MNVCVHRLLGFSQILKYILDSGFYWLGFPWQDDLPYTAVIATFSLPFTDRKTRDKPSSKFTTANDNNRGNSETYVKIGEVLLTVKEKTEYMQKILRYESVGQRGGTTVPDTSQ